MTNREFLLDNNSNIVAAAAGRQSANGLVKSHWKIMVHMFRAYLSENQVPRSFWFYLVVQSARMMNAIPGSTVVNLPRLSCWPTVSAMMSAHGSLYFWCVTSTMSAMATSPARIPNRTQWMVLPLGHHLTTGLQSTVQDELRVRFLSFGPLSPPVLSLPPT